MRPYSLSSSLVPGGSLPAPPEPGVYDVFLAYGVEDEPWVTDLAAELRALSLDHSIERIEWGGDLSEILNRGLAASRSVVLIAVPPSHRSWEDSEWQALLAYSRHQQGRLVPDPEIETVLASVRQNDPEVPDIARLARAIDLLVRRLAKLGEEDARRVVMLRGARLELPRPMRGDGGRVAPQRALDLGLDWAVLEERSSARRERGGFRSAPGARDPLRGPATARTRSPRRGRPHSYGIGEDVDEEGLAAPATAPTGPAEEKSTTPADEVQFTTYAPTTIRPQTWATLLAYCHRPSAASAIEEDRKARLVGKVTRTEAQSTQLIAAGAEITVVPEIPGCVFNPPRASFQWLEDWHRAEFRFQTVDRPPVGPAPTGPTAVSPPRLSGWVSFYLGPILVSEVPIGIRVSPAGEVDERAEPRMTPTTVSPYQAIFVSYSHRDEIIVEHLGRAYKALGMPYLRDVEILRSGEQWNPALLKKIDEADIFQLYWSQSARASTYVEQEWRYARRRRQTSFIRPLYWESPMPDPPPELAKSHFAYYAIG